jgi:hypothetical protein
MVTNTSIKVVEFCEYTPTRTQDDSTKEIADYQFKNFYQI